MLLLGIVCVVSLLIFCIYITYFAEVHAPDRLANPFLIPEVIQEIKFVY
ncbi:hypothetical protein HanPI659440_Chr05g0195181 [Helianthus annuus]|nr:hypothetical protein HanPI659440_Chr05g0195181 [Helianthus annuus]